MKYWLLKSEPTVYAYSDLVRDGETRWDGVRSFEARANLRAMKVGDPCFFYHSNTDRAVVGIARVLLGAYPDPTTEEDWSAVDIVPVEPLVKPVTLAAMKADPALAEMAVVRKSRLSVTPVTAAEWKRVMALGGATKAPRRAARR